ncbi:MAG: NAD-dependent dehydratase [Candidatus Liptonbacteria bacterium RIFCSPHIGHO2_01_FULL_57_28]|uniref:UDP-glucuronate decarboxylase n=1 Tax=Candidatus Liptonbacteria bacterium RIFCSPHIGHO2_01_FULL_57_28 TaxID=1798647 RepID=A0A1G2CBA9_9BACT|nr:MAG: NAD-dependent dehydratase [Candidatus Liptonbacteria bacterium RIFCSPHIGHO2_01_FULL_57_28]
MANAPTRAILIAGGAGFIGSHLAERLLNDDCRVIIADNFVTGSRQNLEHLASNPNLTVVEANVREPLRLDKALADSVLAEIYNLASPASPKHYQKDPIDTLLTNVLGAHNLLELAAKHGADYFQASTSEVYGDPAVHPQTETYWGNVNPIGIRSCYDEGKRAAETLCFDHARKRGAKVRVGRIFNTYGPRMARDDGRVVSNFIVQALAGTPLTIYGDGKQSRSFQYIDDLVAGILAVMRQGDMGPFNLGNPDEFTMRELADKVLAMTGSKSQIVTEPLPQDDPTRRCPDISKARALGWEPKVALEEGLQKTIEYFRGLV